MLHVFYGPANSETCLREKESRINLTFLKPSNFLYLNSLSGQNYIKSGHMSYHLNSVKVMQGTTIGGGIKGDTRSLDWLISPGGYRRHVWCCPAVAWLPSESSEFGLRDLG